MWIVLGVLSYPGGGIAVGADFGWIPRGALSSCTPSTGTHGCFGLDDCLTVGALVLLSTVAGLAISFNFPCAEEQFGLRLRVDFVPSFPWYSTFHVLRQLECH